MRAPIIQTLPVEDPAKPFRRVDSDPSKRYYRRTLKVPKVLVREPRLMVPGQKPVGPIRLRKESPFVANSRDLLLFNNHTRTGNLGYAEPIDAKNSKIWTADTTDGSTPYSYRPISGNMAFCNPESDETGICYYTPLDDSAIDTTTTALVVRFVMLNAPSSDSIGVMQIAASGVENSGSPRWLLTSQDANYLRIYLNGGYRFTSIPVSVSKEQFIAYKFDAGVSYMLSSSKGSGWETYNGWNIAQDSNNALYIGSGYNAQARVGFYLLWHSYGWAPGLAQLEQFARDPWPELVIPA